MFVASHFQYRVEVFFTEIVKGPYLLEQIKCYALSVELQFRGSPLIYSFLWILNPVKLSKETIEEDVAF